MKKYMIFAVGAIVAITASIVNAADNVTVQLKWVTQTQFAGYYVAQDKGFYEAEGLNVTIKAGGPDIGPMSVLAGAASNNLAALVQSGVGRIQDCKKTEL